ncbi:hypothetical protein HWH77_05395 [Bacillus velezensis]|uniref:hypothetical protein n=1 Tax=Bacillus amyloliquefaciens group TaxID=1938374 RepID=UPI0013752A59|nr:MULTISPECIES: hypothetical protein [Bacillus amyloliquefaciens group]MCT6829423.1 hypothetical protein [Bacillus velezensis]MCT6864750.1 hypothetical protein [Bacillus velezensis]NRS34069.1 hypothetical protein [Bacillus velezensis]NRS44627.1 hypothetical protein [Bacillus velezensis]QOX74630.1 hypothetical protein HWH77_05395 [Bacillus velezensis]
MQEMTKEQLQDQLQIAAYKAASLQQELNLKNNELAEYKALYTFADNKRKELEKQINATAASKENKSEPAPVTE